MLDNTTLAQASAPFAALDLSDENDRLVALNAKLAEIGAAETKARERIAELDMLIRDYQEPSGDDVAAALLDGGDATAAAASAGISLASLQDERARLFPALKAFRRKNEDVLGEVHGVRLDIATKMRDAAEPLIEAVMGEAAVAIERLAACFAGLGAISAMGGGAHEQKDCLADVLNAAGALTRNAQSYPVPAEIAAALSPLEGKPGLQEARVPQSIFVPEKKLDSTAFAAGMAEANRRHAAGDASPAHSPAPAPLRGNNVWDRVLGR